jgi:predicted secreted protein
MRRWFTLIALVTLVAGAASGGDIAMFENLGFSESGDVFVFGQYGVAGDRSQPFAEIYAVHVAGNRFLSDGVFELRSDAPLALGQDGRGALYRLLGRSRPVLDRERVDHLATGRPVYILVDGEEPRSRLTFRDFDADVRYDVRLDQEARGSGESVSAAFSVSVTITRADDSVRTLSIGKPSYYRDGVASYRITQVLVGPDEESIVIVVEKRAPDGSIRYMVETAAL